MKIKQLDYYSKEETADLEIDRNSLSSSLTKLPMLHSKWLRFYYEEQERLMHLEKKRRKLFRDKHKYYFTQYEVELKPNQLIYYIESDKEYSELLFKYEVQKKIVEFVDTVLKKIKDQNFIITNIIKWEQYKLGI